MPARRCQRVRFSIFLCFFLRMRLRRFLINDPMAGDDASGWARAAQKDVRSGDPPDDLPGYRRRTVDPGGRPVSEDAPGPQEIKLPDLRLDLGSTDFQYDQAWIAHFQAQEAPQVAGVDPSLFLHDGQDGDEGTRYA